MMNDYNNGDMGMFGWIFVILLLFGFGGGGFGFGGNHNAPATQQGMTDAFNFHSINNQVNDLSGGLCHIGYEMQGGFNNLQALMAQCCCETQKELLQNRYDAERNACNIVNAIHEDGNATRALITSNQMDELRDKLSAARNQLSQQNQSAILIEALAQKTPVPAYLTCSPFESNLYACGRFGNGYGGYNNCGCGC